MLSLLKNRSTTQQPVFFAKKCTTPPLCAPPPATQGNAVLSREGFGPVRMLKFTSRFAIGTPVATLLGNGVVTRFRPSDGIYEVMFQWDATGVRPPVR